MLPLFSSQTWSNHLLPSLPVSLFPSIYGIFYPTILFSSYCMTIKEFIGFRVVEKMRCKQREGPDAVCLLILFLRALAIELLWCNSARMPSFFQNANSDSLIERIYRVNPILSYTKLPLKMPLLPLPYGHCQSQSAFISFTCFFLFLVCVNCYVFDTQLTTDTLMNRIRLANDTLEGRYVEDIKRSLSITL